MARELVKKKIDGYEYEFQQFGPTQGLRYLNRILTIVGEPLSIAMAALFGGDKNHKDVKTATNEAKKSILDKKLDPELIQKCISCLMSNLGDENSNIALVSDLTTMSIIRDGIQLKGFDASYQDVGLDHIFKVLAAQFEVQWGNFFAGFLTKGDTGTLNR